ncbi:GHKL domain-containing protein [Bacteroides congonensis]|uniref:sensor histidine kinase n=1 Tax=Bacteroides congonensis TaxID=1871006 RepID=UPI00321A74FC
MSFWELFCSNTFGLTISTLFMLWISMLLLGRKPYQIRERKVKIIACTILFICVWALIGTVFYKVGIFRWRYNAGQILFTYMGMTGAMFYLYFLYRENLLTCWISAVFLEMLESFAVHIGVFFSPNMTFHLDILGERVGNDNAVVSLLYLLIVFIIFGYAGRQEMQKKQIQTQQISMQQQNAYIESLEKLQSEMRRFRHDYKNMMSGMYLQAKEGNMEAVQNFIQDMTSDFDYQVGEQIRRLTQLGNIHMLEVKGLLLGKMEKMQQEQISCELEVLHPFDRTRLRTTDLCRCLGILIDNAIDEVQGKKGKKPKPQIHIMISSQEECTTFQVRNPLYSNIDFHKIWQQGYSTRGADRGIGLASYKSILQHYENVFSLTTIRDGYFIQELKIQE